MYNELYRLEDPDTWTVLEERKFLDFEWNKETNKLILRPTNNYGNYQYPEKLIPLSVKHLQRGKKIQLHDAGEPVRSWLHVKDTSAAVLQIIDSNQKNQIFNILQLCMQGKQSAIDRSKNTKTY